MRIRSLFFQKAAISIAAFFIFNPSFSAAKPTADAFDVVKKKATAQLVQKQKSAAIQTVLDYLKTNSNPEASLFLIKISQTFIGKEAQENYETSLNSTLENQKEAQKAVDACLASEPQNVDCLIQKMKLDDREKNVSDAEKYFAQLGVFAKGTSVYAWVDLFLHKESIESNFKNKEFMKKITDKASEEFFVLTVLETERAFVAKNFSRAREGIEYFEKNYPDYPDTIYFKQKLDSESSEEKLTNTSETALLYATKCKSLTKSMARKFRYDFDICQRGIL